MEVWSEHLPVIDALHLAEFKFSDFSGVRTGVDWVATDIVLKRSGVEMSTETFALYRIALNAYVRRANELTAQKRQSR